MSEKSRASATAFVAEVIQVSPFTTIIPQFLSVRVVQSNCVESFVVNEDASKRTRGTATDLRLKYLRDFLGLYPIRPVLLFPYTIY